MRPYEAILSLAELVAFTVPAVPRLRGRRRTGHVPLVAPAAALVQAAAEGPRWQLVPAYVLAGVLFPMWAGRAKRPGRVAVILGTVAGAVALAVSTALPAAVPVFRFRTPTGPYGIGTTTYHWVDVSRPELFTADPADHRELLAQVWYPAEKDTPGPHAPYMPDADAVAPVMARLFRFPDFALTHLRYVTTHAVESAPVPRRPARYPVLVFLTGLDGFPEAGTFQIEELVSHGYVVVGLDQPGVAAAVRLPGGRLIPGRSRDEMQPLVTQSVSPRPTMRAVYDGLPGDGYYLEIPGMFHLNFTEVPSWSPLAQQLGMGGPIGGERGFAVVDAYSVAFFDRHLAGRPSALLTGASKPYPEVTMIARAPSPSARPR